MSGRPISGILLGDATGVESETIVKLAASRFYDEYRHPVVIGDVRVFGRGARICGLEIPVQIISKVEEADWTKSMPVLDQRDVDPEQIPFTNISVESGRACLNILKTAIELYQVDRVDGFYFAPLNKRAMIQVGCPSESEHHYVAHPFGHTDPFGEINVLGDLQTTRTTNHIPISKVSESLAIDTIMRAIRLTNVSLKSSGIERPRLALTVLNPHCGEGEKYDREEIDMIMPAIEEAGGMGADADGPLPSDILFIRVFNGGFDGVVVMYHDQGQTAFRLERFGRGVTIAEGLPAPIVTCAHGTACDITEKGAVKTSALGNAVKMAAKMAVHLRDC